MNIVRKSLVKLQSLRKCLWLIIYTYKFTYIIALEKCQDINATTE